MELVKKQIHANQIGKKVIDQFYIDDDYNVPDTKNDVSRVVLSEGSVRVEEMKPVDNYIRVAGKLYFQVLYVTEEGEPRLAALEGKMPFEEMIYVEDQDNGQYMMKGARVEFTATVIHSRKLSIKAMVELEIGAEGIVDEEATVDVDCERPVYKKQKPVELLQMHTSKKDTYRIKEELSIPGTKENIGTMLWTDISSRKLDTKLGQDELLLKGELLVFCFYESQEGKMDWVEQTVPYEGRVECYGADDSMYHHVYATLEDVNVDIRMDEDGEMRAIGIEGTLDLRIAVYEEEQIDLLEDVYSLEQICKLDTREAVYEGMIMQNHSKCKITEQLSLPELKEDILQICHSSGVMQMEHMEVVDEGIQIEGVLHIQFLYVKANDQIPFDTWQGMVPFSYLLESNETCPDMKYDIMHAVEQLTITLLGSDEVEVKAVLAFHSFLRKPIQAEIITDIAFETFKMDEVEKRPGIVGYIVKEGDELWNLAKRYCTTIEGIMDVNDMTSEEIKEGDKILIFKENVSIL